MLSVTSLQKHCLYLRASDISQADLCTASLQVSKQEGRFFYCVCTLTFTFLTVVCLIKWVDLAHFCQVPFISQSSTLTGQKRACWKTSPPWPVLECCTGCPSLDVIPGEGIPCCNSFVLTACFFWSVYLGNVSLVFIRPQSAHKFRWDVAYRRCLPYAGRVENTNPAQTPWSSCLFEQECFNRAKYRIRDKRSDGLERVFCVVRGRNAACERWLLYGLA